MVKKPAKNLQPVRTAIQIGQLPQARRLLRQVLREDPQNHTAWLLLATVTQSPKAALEYIQRAERLQPNSYIAQRVRTSLEQKRHQETKSVGRLTWWSVTPGIGFMILIVILAMWLVPTTTWDQVAALKSDNHLTIGANSIFTVNTKIQNQAIVSTVEAPLAQPAATARTSVSTVSFSAYAAPLPPIESKNEESVAGVTDDAAAETEVTHVGQSIPDAAAIQSGQTSTDEDTAVVLNPPAIVDPAGVRPNRIGADERWIDVDLNTQNLVAYEGDTPVFYSLISSGTWEFPTVTGQFHTWLKYESQDMNGYLLGYDYYLTNVPYVMYFHENFAIHGTYWHNNFGVPMSHGCVNMNPMDAGWLFNWAPLGTMVNIHY